MVIRHHNGGFILKHSEIEPGRKNVLKPELKPEFDINKLFDISD